jgi:hypothetical protein
VPPTVCGVVVVVPVVPAVCAIADSGKRGETPNAKAWQSKALRQVNVDTAFLADLRSGILAKCTPYLDNRHQGDVAILLTACCRFFSTTRAAAG